MTVARQLASLESSGLIRLAQAQPELEYLFRHALVQDAAYSSLVKQDRRQLHQAVGEVLERVYPDRMDELAPLLGRHFDEASDDGRALRCYARAGDAAARVYANAEAVMHYTRALEIAKRATHLEGASHVDGEQLVHLYTGRGRALELSGQHDRALGNYSEMESLAQARGDRSMELAALMLCATLHSAPTSVHDPAAAQALAARALALARELGDRKAEAKVLWNLMLHHFFAGDPATAMTYGEQSLAIARELNLREQLAYTLNDFAGYVSIPAGQYERGIAALEEARLIWRELGNLPMLADNLNNSAYRCLLAGEFEQALALTDESDEVSHPIGNLWGRAYSLGVRGYVHVMRGEADLAMPALEASIEYGEQAGFAAARMIARSLQAILYGFLGAVEPGLEYARDAVAKSEAQVPFWMPQALGSLALLHVFNGNLAEAEVVLGRAIQLSQQGDLLVYSTAVPLAECELGLARGDYAEVVARADEYVERLRQRHLHAFVPFVQYYKGRALLSLDSPRLDEAYQVLTEARADADAIGVRQVHWMILSTLAEIETRRGNLSGARAFRQQARKWIGFIADHAGMPDPSTSFGSPQDKGSGLDLRASVLNLPAVRDVMRAA